MIAQEILKLIESVDPSDKAKLDEIDARVFLYADGFNGSSNGNHYIAHYAARNYPFPFEKAVKHVLAFGHQVKYTRSRDALKAIRPEGWQLEIEQWFGQGWQCSLVECPENGERINAPMWQDERTISFLPTEQLAELHAIIQAIDYDRSNAQ